MNVSKSVCVKGNLKDGNLIYTCYPINEFAQGKWKLAIQAVIFDSSEAISKTCVISSNFITSQRRNARGEVQVYWEPLNVFHLKSSPTAPRGIFRFGLILSDCLISFF